VDPLGLAPYDVTQAGTDIVPYDANFALAQLTRNGDATASDLMNFGKSQGWTFSKSPGGPRKFLDDNGFERLTIKHGSPRAPGSKFPHIEVHDPTDQRVDPFGNQVTRRSDANHVPIIWDLP
jgi:hypothetical protein